MRNKYVFSNSRDRIVEGKHLHTQVEQSRVNIYLQRKNEFTEKLFHQIFVSFPSLLISSFVTQNIKKVIKLFNA